MLKRIFLAVALALTMSVAASAQQTGQRVELGDNVVPIRYQIEVTPNAQAMTLAGDVSIDLQVAAPTREIVLHALELEFDSVRLDGRVTPTVTFDAETQTAHLAFARPVSAGQHSLRITYRGKIYRQAQGMFANDYTNPEGGAERILVTQFEAADARRFVPSFDEPRFKAIFELSLVAPANRMAISNMPEAAHTDLANGLRRTRFQPTPKMSSYLLFAGIGDFERIHTEVDGVDIGVIAKRGDAEQGRFALESAAELLRYYNEYFGVRYPLPKLDMIATPGGGGFAAMENWGAILYFEEYLLIDPNLSSESERQNTYSVVAHEMAHQWFGNIVTMAWWDDLWLNEGYASWMEQKASEHFHPDWNVWPQGQRRLNEAMAQDSRESTHPVIQTVLTAAQGSTAFDRITYEKGQAVIRMLEEYVGEDAFRAGVRAYMQTHAYSNATTQDLWRAIETASSRPMRQIADEFTRQPGVPLIHVDAGACTAGQRVVTLRQSRFGLDAASRVETRWHAPVSALLIGQTQHVEGVIGDDGAATLTLPGCGPFVVNPDNITYSRTLYNRETFAQIAQNFGRLPVAAQMGTLNDYIALGESGDAPYSDFFALAKGTPRDADPIVWTLIARQLEEVDSLYSELPSAAAYRSFARGLLSPVFAQVGWDKRAGESDNVAVLREQLVSALAKLGDPSALAEARRRLNADQLTGPIRRQGLLAAGAGADSATFDALLARARATTDTLEKVRYYDALAAVADPVLAQRALELSFDPDVATAQGPVMIERVSRMHPDLAWRFAAAHEAQLRERLDPFAQVDFLPNLGRRGNSDALRLALRTYIDQRVPADLRRGPEQAYARLVERLQLRAQKLPELDSWLRTQSRSR